jgi:hypothetical protein
MIEDSWCFLFGWHTRILLSWPVYPGNNSTLHVDRPHRSLVSSLGMWKHYWHWLLL